MVGEPVCGLILGREEATRGLDPRRDRGELRRGEHPGRPFGTEMADPLVDAPGARVAFPRTLEDAVSRAHLRGRGTIGRGEPGREQGLRVLTRIL